MTNFLKLCLAFAVLFAPLYGHPQEGRKVRAAVGTGFFVNSAGYLITNAHVVRECQDIWVRGPLNEKNVKLVATDETVDLALLRADGRPPHTAPMRFNQGLKEGDEVMLMGYPGDAIREGRYVIRKASIISTNGPPGRSEWLEFSDSARKGNSGGPLLDGHGNVIGVVTGKYTQYDMTDSNNAIHSDVAVNMPVLLRFLDKHFVTYDRLISYDEILKFRPMDTTQIESRGKQYIVGVVCVKQ